VTPIASQTPAYLDLGLVAIVGIIVGVLALQRVEQGPLYSVARRKGRNLLGGVKRRKTAKLGRKED
jgi:hypothetical protein